MTNRVVLAEDNERLSAMLNARERTAQNGMRLISERRGAEKKGLLKRIFD